MDSIKRSIYPLILAGNTRSNRLNDFVLTSEGHARATVRTIPQERTQGKPNWLFFVRVESVAESLASTKKLGGSVLLPANRDLLNGRAAVVADPTGAAIGLLEWTPVQVEEER